MRLITSAAICVLACIIGNDAAAQWSTTGNSGTTPGTHFIGTTDAKDFVFKVQNIERGRIINSGGVWRFGNSTNFAKIDGGGKLTFGGTGVYQIGSNKYVYQYAGTPNIGLFYNATSSFHEFRDINGAVAASIGASSGNGYYRGSLGIGTTTPSFKLDVAGTGRFTGAVKIGAYTLPATDGVSGQVLTSNGAGTVAWTTVSGGSSSSTSQWTSNGSNIDYAFGNVGIANANPAYKLDVNGTARFTSPVKIGAYTLPAVDGVAGQVLTSNGAGVIGWTTVSSGSSTATSQWTTSGTTINYATGNVGIGNTTPTFKLDVNGTARFTNAVKIGAYTMPATDGAAGQVLVSNGAGTLAWTTVSSGTSTSTSQWTTNGTNIDYATGNVGIGNTTPLFKLDVNGAGRFTSSLKIGAYTLPATDGAAGQVLSSNGAGTVAWTTVSSGTPSQWTTNGSNIDYATGNVGIGNTTPLFKLDVNGTARFTSAVKIGAYTLPATDGVSGQVLTSNGAGAVAWTTVSSGTPSQWTTTAGNISFATGNVGIGTADLATGYKLSVKGKIMCEEVKVQLETSWPDYVFRNGYALMPLEEVATHIEREQHLPGIPSAKEIKEDGLNVGEMQAKMMEKIEELTLYLIDANQDIHTLQQHNDLLQQRINKLEKSGN